MTDPSLAHRRRRRIRGALKHVLLTAGAVLMLYPILWMVISSLRPDELIFSRSAFSLSELSFDNFR